ncbi:MAG TPA: hypothetical protein VK843_05440 [Planctomycetota bacterium]|nr:hypothetical protein [Planctomycetota bacterium]
MTVLEVTIALAITSTVLLASGAAFMSSIASVNSAQRTSRGALFAQTVMEDLAAQPYANLAAFNGNTIFDEANAADSHFSVGLTVFTAAVDLIQVRAVIRDLHTGRELGRLTTLRANR